MATTTTAPPAASAPAPVTPATPAVAPPIVIDFGDAANQIIASLEPIAASAASAGINLAAGEIPGGSLILAFFGQNMVSQFVASGAAALEGLLKGKSVSISSSNALETMVLNAINTELPSVGTFFSTELPGWISAEVAKIAPKLSTAAAPATTGAP